MKNPLERFKEALKTSIKKEAIIFGILYCLLIAAITLILGFGIAVVAVISLLTLAVVNNYIINAIAVLIGLLLISIILLLMQAMFEITSLTGFRQILNVKTTNFEHIANTIKKRIIPFFAYLVITLLFYSIIIAIPTVPLYFLFQTIGAIIGIILGAIIVLAFTPIIIMIPPIIALRDDTIIESIRNGIRLGLHNYTYNLVAIAIMIIAGLVISIPSMIASFLSIIPGIGVFLSIIGSILTIPFTIYATILLTLYTLKIYEENIERTGLR